MKQKIEEWIRGHPIEAFFLLAIAMSFGLLFPVFLIIRQEDVLGQILFLFLGRIGTYSPVLAGMFVARIIQPGRQRVSLTAVFHASMNSINPLMGVFPITTTGNILLVGLAMVAVVSDRMWRRLPGGHPAVYQDDATSASAASSV